MDSFTPRSLNSRGKSPRYPLDRRLGGPQIRCGRGGEEKNSSLCRESSSSHLVQSLVTVLIELQNYRIHVVCGNIMLSELTKKQRQGVVLLEVLVYHRKSFSIHLHIYFIITLTSRRFRHTGIRWTQQFSLRSIGLQSYRCKVAGLVKLLSFDIQQEGVFTKIIGVKTMVNVPLGSRNQPYE